MSQSTRHGVLKWCLCLASLLLVGPVVGWLVGGVMGPEGSTHATGLVSSSPVGGLVRTVAAVGLAGVVIVVCTDLVGLAFAMSMGGLALAWGAWRSGRLEMLARQLDGGALLPRFTLEVVVLSVALGVFVLYAARREARRSGRGGEELAVALRQQQTLVGMLIAFGVAGAASWLLARSGAVGQTFAAAVGAGLFGTTVGRISAPKAPLVAFLLALLALAAVSPLVALMTTSGDLDAAIYAGRVLPQSRIMPLDWLSGLLVGVPLGAAWATSLIDKHEVDASARTSPTASA